MTTYCVMLHCLQYEMKSYKTQKKAALLATTAIRLLHQATRHSKSPTCWAGYIVEMRQSHKHSDQRAQMQ